MQVKSTGTSFSDALLFSSEPSLLLDSLSFQACFISLEDLYASFDTFWPFLENKIWLKVAISIACQYFQSSLIDEVSYMIKIWINFYLLHFLQNAFHIFETERKEDYVWSSKWDSRIFKHSLIVISCRSSIFLSQLIFPSYQQSFFKKNKSRFGKY